MKKIKRLLIANRGEIAVRIIRTCQEMGIVPISVYSQPDRIAPHVLLAAEAYSLEGATAAETYLNMDRILAIARRARADAIHPGYGFLAENAAFAERVREEGLIFVGPSAETMRLMGDKTASRRLMEEAGVPIIPGNKEALPDVETARAVAQKIGGYPVMLKASAGGGGKGMRIVQDAAQLPRALSAAQNEARKAFGDDRVYMEKCIESPRHIEMQILADHQGNVVHLWERECSIQRRHQKLVEECPSVVLSPEQREKMGEIAIRAARACHYLNAGTVEFLFDKDGKFYFLEMNTRLQVEHPVTELALGVDLVKLQLLIAAGEPIPFRQSEVRQLGHAIELRINAEDVFANFAPSTGRVEFLELPGGPGVRVDSGINTFSEITMHYDPLIAKVIAFGRDRPESVQRLIRALREFKISGIKTTIPFGLFVLQHPDFVAGNFDTSFVERHWRPGTAIAEEAEIAAVLAAAVKYHQEKTALTRELASNSRARKSEVSTWKLLGLKKMLRSGR